MKTADAEKINGFRVTRSEENLAAKRVAVETRFVARMPDGSWKTVWQRVESADGMPTIYVALAPTMRRYAEAAGQGDPVRTEIHSTPRISPDGAAYVQKEVPSAPSTGPRTRPR